MPEDDLTLPDEVSFEQCGTHVQRIARIAQACLSEYAGREGIWCERSHLESAKLPMAIPSGIPIDVALREVMIETGSRWAGVVNDDKFLLLVRLCNGTGSENTEWFRFEGYWDDDWTKWRYRVKIFA